MYGLFSSLGDLFGVALIFVGLWYLFQLIANWRIFAKAGIPGWHSLIPILNVYDQFKLAWSGGIGVLFLALTAITGYMSDSGEPSTLLNLLGIAVAVLTLVQNYKLAKAFGHGLPFALGLLFFNPIFVLALGFGSSEYQGPLKTA